MAILVTRPPSLLSALLVMSALVGRLHAGDIAIYWGQNGDEGTLADTCLTGNYNLVILSFLFTFGDGKNPELDLSSHCDPSDDCTELSNDVHKCQEQGVKVLLSLGGGSGEYGLVSDDDASKVADYLWNNFLSGGDSDSRPLGNAVLDGIDFDIEGPPGQRVRYWDVLARRLKGYSSDVLLSAAPGCSFPDAHLSDAFKTELFDYVWPQFYEDTDCQYDSASGDIEKLTNAWNDWNTVPVKKVLLGLPASESATTKNGDGYIPPDVLKSKVLPAIKDSEKYGGIMLWSRYYDDTYSSFVKSEV